MNRCRSTSKHLLSTKLNSVRRPFFSLSAEPVPWFLLLSAPNSKMPSNKAPPPISPHTFLPMSQHADNGCQKFDFHSSTKPVPAHLRTPIRSNTTFIEYSNPDFSHLHPPILSLPMPYEVVQKIMFLSVTREAPAKIGQFA